jgi:predicted RNase H-like nuclease (RuvC/YqgF family)
MTYCVCSFPLLPRDQLHPGSSRKKKLIELLQGVVKNKEAEMASIRGRLGAMQRERDRLRADLQESEVAAVFGRTAREQIAKSSRELADLQNRHESESRKRRQLEMELERAKLSADRAARRNGESSLVQAL